MTTYQLGLPSELKRALISALPRQNDTYSPVVRVTPRDGEGRKCPAYAAEMYEIQAYYTTTDSGSLNLLQKALDEIPGVYLTTQVRPVRGVGNEASNPAWPTKLGVSRRNFHRLRPQVLALIRDWPS